MNTDKAQVIQKCAQGALSGKLAFPEIVRKLAEIGIERYHADYSRQEITYYFPDGDSLVVASPHPSHTTAVEFSSSAVEAAVPCGPPAEHVLPDPCRLGAPRQIVRRIRQFPII